MAENEIKEAQELNEEQLEDVSGGSRVMRACSRMTSEENDSVFIGILESTSPEEENLEHGWDPGMYAVAGGDDELSRVLRMRSN